LENKITLTIFPVDIKPSDNEYSDQLKTRRFKEAIRVDETACVYRRWEFTQVSYESMLMARFPI
jgi:adenine specific DNA methylase Mod